MDRLRNYYEKIESRYTAEELSAKVMNIDNRVSSVKKRSPKRIAAIAACFAVIVCSTVAVGAATDWNYVEAFSRIFGEKAENIREYVPEKEEVIENTFTLADFTVDAAAVSNNGMYLMIGVETKNGAVLDENFRYNISIDSDSEEYDGYGMKEEVIEKTSDSAKILMALGGKLEGGNITVRISDCSVEQGAVWEVKLTPPALINEITKELNTVIGFPEEVINSDKHLVQGEDSKIRARSMTVSAIDAEISGIFELWNGAIPCKERIWAEMKNGDKISIFAISSRGEVVDQRDRYSLINGSVHISFIEPIDINELSAIVFDDERIEF